MLNTADREIDRSTNSHRDLLIRRLRALRALMWRKHYDRAQEFACGSARGWKDEGWAGVAFACWALSQEMYHVEGGYDAYEEARALGCLFATEARKIA